MQDMFPVPEASQTSSQSHVTRTSDLHDLGADQGIRLPDTRDVVAEISPSRDRPSWHWTDAEWQLPLHSVCSVEDSICSMFEQESCSDIRIADASHCYDTLPQLDLAAADIADFFPSDDIEIQSG